MNRVLRLYPRPWRERYLDEVADLLADRPPTLRDQIDLLRGALDAWLHPQVTARASAHDEEPIVKPVAAAALALFGGLLWATGGVVQHVGPYDTITGYKDSSGVMIVIAAALVTALAAVARTWATASPSRGMRRASVAMLLLMFLMAAPWPILVIGYWGHLVATIAFGAVLAFDGRRSGSPLAFGAMVAVTFNTETAFALATVPLGIAWIAVGIEGLLRPRLQPIAGGA
jgi:hypothetical protein